MTLTGVDGSPVYIRKSHIVHVSAGTHEKPNPAYTPRLAGDGELAPDGTPPKTLREPCLVLTLKQSQPVAVGDTAENRTSLEHAIVDMDHYELMGMGVAARG